MGCSSIINTYSSDALNGSKALTASPVAATVIKAAAAGAGASVSGV